MLGPDEREPRGRRGEALLVGPLREREEVVEVPLADGLLLFTFLEPLGRVLADRLQHPEARSVVLVPTANEVLVEEGLKRVGVGARNVLGGLIGAAGEDGESAEELLLVVREKVVAPFDRRPQGLLPGIGIASGLEQVEPLRDPLEELLGGEELRPRGRQLDRERHAVQASAQLGDGLRCGELRTLAEERDGLLVRELRHLVLPLPGYAKRLPAGNEEGELGASLKQRPERGRGIDDLLEVVEEKEHCLSADVGLQAVLRPQHLGDGLEHELGIADSGDRNPEGPVRVLGSHCPRGFEREPGLARPARSGERDEARTVRDEGDDLAQLAFPADEGARRRGQVRYPDRPERREGLLAELEQPLEFGEILEAVLAEIYEVELDELGRGRGDEHLPAMSGCRDAGGSMDVITDVALLGQERRPRVQADPHLHLRRRERLCHLFRCRKRTGCSRKGEEEGIALRVDFDAVVASAGLADHATVLGERLRVVLSAKLVQKRRRAFDIGEEEGDGS
ncbi:MAG: hypothetical protein HW413_1036 [Thermoleophilia bacterium]|nr:hypothetical protein [Thermoleophilia bacterium]